MALQKKSAATNTAAAYSTAIRTVKDNAKYLVLIFQSSKYTKVCYPVRLKTVWTCVHTEGSIAFKVIRIKIYTLKNTLKTIYTNKKKIIMVGKNTIDHSWLFLRLILTLNIKNMKWSSLTSMLKPLGQITHRLSASLQWFMQSKGKLLTQGSEDAVTLTIHDKQAQTSRIIHSLYSLFYVQNRKQNTGLPKTVFQNPAMFNSPLR